MAAGGITIIGAPGVPIGAHPFGVLPGGFGLLCIPGVTLGAEIIIPPPPPPPPPPPIPPFGPGGPAGSLLAPQVFVPFDDIFDRIKERKVDLDISDDELIAIFLLLDDAP